MTIQQLEAGTFEVRNQYPRVVKAGGKSDGARAGEKSF